MRMNKNLQITISPDDLQLNFSELERKYVKYFLQAYSWQKETRKNYRFYLSTVCEYFNDYPTPFFECTADDFELAMADTNCWRRAFSRKPYSESTNNIIRSVINDFTTFVEFYSNEYYIKDDRMHNRMRSSNNTIIPSDKTNKPLHTSKSSRKQIENDKIKRIESIVSPRSLTLSQEILLFDAIDKHIEKNCYYAGLALCFYLGLRPGECCGVKYGDMRPLEGYPKTRCLYIYEQIKDHNKTSNDLKTPNAYRVLPVPEELDYLLSKRRTAVENRLNGSADHCYIVCAGESIADLQTSCNRDMFRSFAQRILNKIKVDERLSNDMSKEISAKAIFESNVTTYLLRRNFATALSGVCGMDDDELKYLMGHDIGIANEKRHDFVNPDILFHLWEKLNLRTYRTNNSRSYTIDSQSGQFVKIQKKATLNITPSSLKTGGIYIRVFNEYPNDYIYAEADGQTDEILYRTALEPSELKRIGRLRLHNEFAEAVEEMRKKKKE